MFTGILIGLGIGMVLLIVFGLVFRKAHIIASLVLIFVCFLLAGADFYHPLTADGQIIKGIFLGTAALQGLYLFLRLGMHQM